MPELPLSLAPPPSHVTVPDGEVSGRRLTAEGRRRAILEAARQVFARRGFHGAGTAELAAAAGCSEPMLYKHFPSKLDLFVAVLEDNRAFVCARLAAAADGADDPLSTITELKRGVLDQPGFAERIRLRTLAVGMAHEPAVRDVLEATGREIRAFVADQIRLGQDRGTVRADVDPDRLAWIWIGISLTVGFRQAVEGDAVLPEMGDVMDAFHDLLHLPPEGSTP